MKSLFEDGLFQSVELFAELDSVQTENDGEIYYVRADSHFRMENFKEAMVSSNDSIQMNYSVLKRYTMKRHY